MFINKISITNFKSIYGTQEFDFRELVGMNKLSGPIGAGKTTICDAIIYGLYGKVKNQKVTSLVAWNTKEMEVSIELKSSGKLLYIKRGNSIQTELYVNGKQVVASGKRDMQEVINSYYDVPQMFVEKMCVISFDASKMSLLSMTPTDTKKFIDDVFGFSLFTEYSNVSNRYCLDITADIKKLETSIITITSTISSIEKKMSEQVNVMKEDISDDNINNDIKQFENSKKQLNIDLNKLQQKLKSEENSFINKTNELNKKLLEQQNKKNEITVLGKEARKQYELIKTGICQTCGQPVSQSETDIIKKKIEEYREQYEVICCGIKCTENDINLEKDKFRCYKLKNKDERDIIEASITRLNTRINELKYKLHEYEVRMSAVKENYTDIIKMSQSDLKNQQNNLSLLKNEYNNWSELNNLLSKHMRWSLMEKIIPNINSAIQSYISNIGLPFYVTFDQEFNSHIYSSYYKKEISYTQLSTGQKKSIDMAVIFGILSNIIISSNFNIIILDELFSNMDTETRSIMLNILKSTKSEKQSVFVINHSEMDDDWFDHKINVRQQSSTVISKNGPVQINKSIYNIVF